MKQNIRLTWDRNQDKITTKYRIYRATDQYVEQGDTCILEVSHPILPNYISVTKDPLIYVGSGTYRVSHDHLSVDPVKVYVNSQELNPATYLVDRVNGIFRLVNPPTGELTADYKFDGVRVLDTSTPQPGVKYWGPPPKEYKDPTTPGSLSALVDIINNRVILSWPVVDKIGQDYYYRIEAMDGSGYHSKLSIINKNINNINYLIERSQDQITWQEVTTQAGNVYIEKATDISNNTEPIAINNLKLSEVSSGLHSSQVKLSWDVTANEDSIYTFYRVKSVGFNDVKSDPTIIVPVVAEFNRLKEIRILRKDGQGKVSLFEGGPGSLLINSANNLIAEYIDTPVATNSICTYTLYVQDIYNNYTSPPVHLTVTVKDTFFPAQVINLRVQEFWL